MTDADYIRELIAAAGMSQRAAARRLKDMGVVINARAMRAYCAGKPVPPDVIEALEALAAWKHSPIRKSYDQTNK